MMSRAVKRTLFPALAFALFLLAGMLSPALLPEMSAEAMERTGQVLVYAVQIGGWLAGGFLVVRLIDVFFWEGLVARTIDAPVPRLLKDALNVVVFLIAGTGIVGSVFHQSVTGIWATSSVVGLVIGFALRGIILDIFSGLAINIDRSYRIGDWVELHDRDVRREIFGQVVEINWRTTRIELLDKTVMVVPNSRLGSQPLTNYSLPDDLSRFEIKFCLDFSVPAERAVRVLLAGAKAACDGVELVERPEPQVLAGAATPLGVEYILRYWTRVARISPPIARDRVMRSVLDHLDRAGLALAYPKQDLFLARMPARHLDFRTREDRVLLLSRVDLFAGALTQDELQSLVDKMLLRGFRAGELLIRQGDPGLSMFVLAEGLLEVRQHGAGEGGDERVGQIKPGEFFGEMSLLTGEERSATVAAMTDVVAYEITYAHLAALLEARPAMAQAIAEAAAARRLRSAELLAQPLRAAAGGTAQAAPLSHQILTRMTAFFRTVFTGA